MSAVFLVQVFVTSAQNAGSISNSLPSRIITTDGITYNGPKLLNVAPDGLVIEYLLDSGGTGMAKLKFAKLADLLQKRFGYDPKKALRFESEQSKLMTAIVQKEQLEEVKRTEVRAEMSRKPDLITVHAADPSVDYQYYDVSGPKPSIIANGMTGNTRKTFECQSIPTIRLVQKDENAGDYVFRCEEITIEIGLSNTITVPKGAHQKLIDHEEGHRKINEHFYTLGQQAALRAANSVQGKEFVFLYVKEPKDFGPRYEQSAFRNDLHGMMAGDEALIPIRRVLATFSKDLHSIESETVRIVQSTLQAEYWQYTMIPAGRANNFYDEITDHGRNDVDSDKAAQEAIDRFRIELAN